MIQITTDEANSICSRPIVIKMKNANSVDLYGIGSWPPKDITSCSPYLLCYNMILGGEINRVIRARDIPNYKDAFPKPSDDATEANKYI